MQITRTIFHNFNLLSKPAKMNMLLTGIRVAVWDYVRCARRQPGELIVFVMIHALAAGTYCYGMFYLLDEVHGDSSELVRFLHMFLATWIFLMVLVNSQLIRIRSSSIQNKILIPPPPETGPPGTGFPIVNDDGSVSNGSQDENSSYRGNKSGNNHLTEDLKHLAQQFTNRPYNSDTAWHICATCETFVPPRCWHCQTCETCVFRRDHHCFFLMKCIGEDNQANFLGFLFYIAFGTGYCSVLSYIHGVYFLGVPYWMWFLKTMVAFYTIFYDFSLCNIIISVNFSGCFTALGIFFYYVWLALRGQTSADRTRKISRTPVNGSKLSYQNLESFLGPNPILRIVWPFHKIVHNSYCSQGGGGGVGLGGTTKDL